MGAPSSRGRGSALVETKSVNMHLGPRYSRHSTISFSTIGWLQLKVLPLPSSSDNCRGRPAQADNRCRYPCPELDRGAEFVPLAGMIENDIEDDFDPRPMQCLHHIAKFAQMAGLLEARRSSPLAARRGRRSVAPVMPDSGAPSIGLVPPTSVSSNLKDREEFDGGDPQGLEIGDLSTTAAKVPGWRPGGRGARETADVHLIDDRLAHWPVDRRVALPIVGDGIDDSAAQRGHAVIAGTQATPRFQNVVEIPRLYGSMTTLAPSKRSPRPWRSGTMDTIGIGEQVSPHARRRARNGRSYLAPA